MDQWVFVGKRKRTPKTAGAEALRAEADHYRSLGLTPPAKKVEAVERFDLGWRVKLVKA